MAPSVKIISAGMVAIAGGSNPAFPIARSIPCTIINNSPLPKHHTGTQLRVPVRGGI